MKNIIVTGGAGFIGTNFVRQWLQTENTSVIVMDKLTYAGNYDSLAELEKDARFTFYHADICDKSAVENAFRSFHPQAVVHFAAESHVDRSIDGPETFVKTNVVGTFQLLEGARHFHKTLSGAEKDSFRFIHVSTDEVFGSLGSTGKFTETTPYDPRSPYSASKAASDHFARAYFHTYHLPVLLTNCSNNYGPYQFPEKLIPLIILNCLEGKPLPIYGDGMNVRDWIFVEDHCSAIRAVLKNGTPGNSYNIGGNCEKPNIEIVKTICRLVDEMKPDLKHGPCESLITYVKDRPGHDRRYAMNNAKIEKELGWTPSINFETGLRRTVLWYLEHTEWCERITSGVYQRQRLGTLE
ncbi:MAG: dTDP-glucose 4,6-dehydratase [Planctomycetia bacterium]|nr:dTDP-glucose 4,6-dehydratase [Planctomycetia bacterium]